MKFNIRSYLKSAFTKGTSINDYNVKFAAIIGSVGHPLFAVAHIYIFGMPWDSVLLKGCGAVICLLLLTKNKWPSRFKTVFSFYWHFMLIYNLPFLITLTALNNDFIKTWFMWEVIMIYILIMYVPHWLVFLIDLIIGITLALLLCNVGEVKMIDGILHVGESANHDVLLYIATFSFAVISGLVFSYSNAQGVASEERAKIFKSLAGSIAHELRNPLNTINLIGSQIDNLASSKASETIKTKKSDLKRRGFGDKKPNTVIVPNDKKRLQDLSSDISEAIAGANSIIDVILGDLSGKNIEEDDFAYLSPNEIMLKVVRKFGYQGEGDKSKIRMLFLDDDKDKFLIKAVPERLTFVIYNLLKNALYYADKHPNLVVTIGDEVRQVNGVKYNVVYVQDNGPGIAADVMPKLFNDFYTSNKKGGTGLGLAFCKRNMKMFGGDIICESELGKWTKFSLLFPRLSRAEIEASKAVTKKRKILLVDDQEINLITTKAKIERTFPYITCTVTDSGKQAVALMKSGEYDLLLTDIQMPEISGIKVAQQVRSFNKTVPIIALTSLGRDLLQEEIMATGAVDNFNSYLSKSSAPSVFFRSITKWLFGCEDDFAYLGDKKDYQQVFAKKRVLLADDQRLNRMMIKKTMEGQGMEVVDVEDGMRLLEAYKESLDVEGKSSFDMVVTDINMPLHSGDWAAMEIRKIERIHKISHHDEMPIIAISGDGEKQDIRHFFDCQMTDYFIKGSNPEMLFKIIANYIVARSGFVVDKEKEMRPKKPGKATAKVVMLEKKSVRKKKNQDEALAAFKILSDRVIDNFDKKEQKKLLKLFLKDSAEVMLQIRRNIGEGDVKKLLLNVHIVKGISANIGADRLFYYIKTVEPKLRSGIVSNDWHQELERSYGELVEEIALSIKN